MHYHEFTFNRLHYRCPFVVAIKMCFYEVCPNARNVWCARIRESYTLSRQRAASEWSRSSRTALAACTLPTSCRPLFDSDTQLLIHNVIGGKNDTRQGVPASGPHNTLLIVNSYISMKRFSTEMKPWEYTFPFCVTTHGDTFTFI